MNRAAGTNKRPSGPTGKDSRGPGGGDRLRSGGDQGDGEAVVALAADRLDRGRVDPRVGGDQLVEAALGGDRRVLALRRLSAIADDVVGDDQAAGAGASSDQAKYSGVLALSASMKTKLKGPAPSASSRGRASSAGPTRSSTTPRGRLGRGSRGDLGVVGIGLERDQPPPSARSPAEPDRAVPARLDLDRALERAQDPELPCERRS